MISKRKWAHADCAPRLNARDFNQYLLMRAPCVPQMRHTRHCVSPCAARLPGQSSDDTQLALQQALQARLRLPVVAGFEFGVPTHVLAPRADGAANHTAADSGLEYRRQNQARGEAALRNGPQCTGRAATSLEGTISGTFSATAEPPHGCRDSVHRQGNCVAVPVPQRCGALARNPAAHANVVSAGAGAQCSY